MRMMNPVLSSGHRSTDGVVLFNTDLTDRTDQLLELLELLNL